MNAMAQWEDKYRNLKAAPRSLIDIERWLKKRNSFHSMPSDSESHRELGPQDLTSTVPSTQVQPALKRWVGT
jgi:hypothetical protein